MAYKLQQESDYNLVLLIIKVDIAWLDDTLFSDMNATDNLHSHGATLEDLKKVDIDATKNLFLPKTSPIFKQHQAEILVKTCVPIEYIKNIDNPISL